MSFHKFSSLSRAARIGITGAGISALLATGAVSVSSLRVSTADSGMPTAERAPLSAASRASSTRIVNAQLADVQPEDAKAADGTSFADSSDEIGNADTNAAETTFENATADSPAALALAAYVPPKPTSRIIRAGLSTRGAPVVLWSSTVMSITDGEQPGRRLLVNAGDNVTFTLGAASVTAGAKKWSGPISIRTGSGTYGGWRLAKVYVAGGPTHVSTNGETPRYQRAYRGSFEIAPQTFSFEPATHKSNLRVVNVLPLDEYLKGVVPWEMNPTAPLEALKAQSICARSETLAKIAGGRHTQDGFDICDYDHCQGYSGTENEKPASSIAVEQTAGLAIYYQGRIADAVYFTNSGGVTAAKDDIWRGPPAPHLQSVRDFSPTKHPAMARLFSGPMTEAAWASYCTNNLPSYAQPSQSEINALAERRRSSPRTAELFQEGDLPEFYRWTRVVPIAGVAQAMSARVPMPSATEIRVLERAPSGHIKKLMVVGRDANGQTLTASFEKDSQIRSMFSGRLGSTTALPSSTFVVLPRRNPAGVLTDWVFKGAGWGHGAGMCQRGAQNHAREGWNARQIINHYFRDVQIQRTG
ncbi:MAG TPA: SpoIID/LytB domain-containing protein [Abditibacteriaceae bacterium]